MNAVTEKPAPTVEVGLSQAPPPVKRGLRKIVLRGTIAAVVLIAAVVGGSWWFTEGRWIESTDNAYVQGDISVLSTRIEGDVVSIAVGDNQAVHAGDPLITLDPADWQARLDQARGAVAEAAAATITAQRQVDQSLAMIAQADANIDQAQAESTRATADAARSKSLVGAGWTSRQADETIIATAKKAEAAMASAQAQKQAAQQAMQVAKAQISQAQARQVTAESAVKLAANSLSYTTIRSPIDGIVGNRAAQLGQHVQPGQQLIAVSPPPEKLFVVANFKETQMRLLRPGQKVVLTPDIDSGAAVSGTVASIAPATGALFSLLPPENATGNFTKVVQRIPVKIVIDPAEAASATWLRAGLSVTAEVDTRGPAARRLGLFGAATAMLHLR